MTIKNAIITDVTITNDDHGCLSAWLTLDYGDCGMQGFGGYNLYIPRKNTKSQANYAGHFIWRVMEVADVTKWNKLINKCIRVNGDSSGINKIGHITKDIWFDPKLEFSELRDKSNET